MIVNFLICYYYYYYDGKRIAMVDVIKEFLFFCVFHIIIHILYSSDLYLIHIIILFSFSKHLNICL